MNSPLDIGVYIFRNCQGAAGAEETLRTPGLFPQKAMPRGLPRTESCPQELRQVCSAVSSVQATVSQE